MPDVTDLYRVFLASPGGLDDARAAFEEEVAELNLRRQMRLEVVAWEDQPGGVGRPQERINESLRECDFCVLVFWDRWGSPPDKDRQYSSATEEEFYEALECLEDPARRMRDVVVFFRDPSPGHLADPGPQLQKILDFRKKLAETKEHLYKPFAELDEFRRELRLLFASWLNETALSPAEPHRPSALAPCDPSRIPFRVPARRSQLVARGCVGSSRPTARSRR